MTPDISEYVCVCVCVCNDIQPGVLEFKNVIIKIHFFIWKDIDI